MKYFLTFAEGIVTFLSPCILPMIPLYLAYFAGSKKTGKNELLSALFFILGFTIVFLTLGAFAGLLGGFLREYRRQVNLVAGLIMVCFGLDYLNLFPKKIFSGGISSEKIQTPSDHAYLQAFLFGLVFSISWTPCLGPLLGSALLLASTSSGFSQGILLLLCYSLGLAIPFFLTALVLDQLKGAFDGIKRHMLGIQRVCGSLLILLGIFIATGLMDKIYYYLS